MGDCLWDGCRNPSHDGLPICFVHAYLVHRQIDDLLTENPPAKSSDEPLVYYLALSPTTVKIGTTTNLPQRLTALRTEMQYVLAVEPGGRDVERMRHQQFAAERIGRREDFRVSDALQAHIASLISPQKARPHEQTAAVS